MRLSGFWPTISGQALPFLAETYKGASLMGCYYVNGLLHARGLNTIVIVVLRPSRNPIRAMFWQRIKDLSSWKVQATKIRSGFSTCDLAGNNQTLASSEDLRQVSDFRLETCASSLCTVCPALPIHYTRAYPYRGLGCLRLPD